MHKVTLEPERGPGSQRLGNWPFFFFVPAKKHSEPMKRVHLNDVPRLCGVGRRVVHETKRGVPKLTHNTSTILVSARDIDVALHG